MANQIAILATVLVVMILFVAIFGTTAYILLSKQDKTEHEPTMDEVNAGLPPYPPEWEEDEEGEGAVEYDIRQSPWDVVDQRYERFK